MPVYTPDGRGWFLIDAPRISAPTAQELKTTDRIVG